MSLRTGEIAHLLFSTRHAKPETSSGFNREIVAESRGVPPAVRQELADLADMTGFILRQPELPPLWAMRRVDAEHWLVVRAVSLGFYRKGNHQLLAHGLVLRREDLQRLGGNPFLLATAEARQAGIRFESEHPDGRDELPPLRLDPEFRNHAARLNLERFRRLSSELPAAGLAVGPLVDSLVVRRRPTGWVAADRPDPSWFEWFLLHLHPCDRAELAFHTWYAYDSPRRFDLLGVAAQDAEELRHHLRGEVELLGEGTPPPAVDVPLGEALERLRERDLLRYEPAVETYYLTLLEPRFRPDLLEGDLDPLTPEQALVCVRHECGDGLTADEVEVVRRLAARSGTVLFHHADRLARDWDAGVDAFTERLERYEGTRFEASLDDCQRTLDLIGSPRQRWALLALLATAPPPLDEHELLAIWRRVAAAGALDAVLALFDDGRKAELAAYHLRPWMELDVVHAAAEVDGSPAWAAYLRLLAAHGYEAEEVSALFEQRIDQLDGDRRLAGYRELERVAFAAGRPDLAIRWLFEGEVPRLSGAGRRIRLGDGVDWLLDLDDAVAVTMPNLAEPEVAGAFFEHVVDGYEKRRADDEPRAWARCRRLFERLGPLPEAVQAPAAELLAQLAEVEGRVGDGFALLARGAADEGTVLFAATVARLEERIERGAVETVPIRGIATLLQVRASGALGPLADRALLALLPRVLVWAAAHPAGDKLRSVLGRWLERLAGDARLPLLAETLETATRWRNVLLDQLQLAPAFGDDAEVDDDPRLRAYRFLAWCRVAALPAERRGELTGAAFALLRGTGGRPPSRAALAGAIPEDLAGAGLAGALDTLWPVGGLELR